MFTHLPNVNNNNHNLPLSSAVRCITFSNFKHHFDCCSDSKLCAYFLFRFFSTRGISYDMKLLTHNLLSSKCLKGVKVGYPLRIVVKDVKISESEFNSEFVTKLIPKLDWKVLVNAAVQIGHGSDLPQELNDDYEDDEELLRKIHHVLMEVEVINGELICPETERSFPISAGIPNLLLNEDEVS